MVIHSCKDILSVLQWPSGKGDQGVQLSYDDTKWCNVFLCKGQSIQINGYKTELSSELYLGIASLYSELKLFSIGECFWHTSV